MQKLPFAKDVMKNVLTGSGNPCRLRGKPGSRKTKIIVDLASVRKSLEQNYELLAKLDEMRNSAIHYSSETSRKGFLGKTLARNGEPRGRKAHLGTAATVTASSLGGAHIVRVHDVTEMAQVARVADSILDMHYSWRSFLERNSTMWTPLHPVCGFTDFLSWRNLRRKERSTKQIAAAAGAAACSATELSSRAEAAAKILPQVTG